MQYYSEYGRYIYFWVELLSVMSTFLLCIRYPCALVNPHFECVSNILWSLQASHMVDLVRSQA